jgi:hypothetical protein
MSPKTGLKSRTTRRVCLLAGLVFSNCVALSSANNSVHISYHWHLHQPIYWPDYKPGTNRYQFAAESVDLKLSNTGNYYPGSSYEHPRNMLVQGDGGEGDNVFDKADRVAAYQDGGKNSIATILDLPDAGAQVSYSGSLQENIWSFGKDNRYGYGTGWNSGYTTARSWTTSSGKPRADMVGMTYHHAFSPLIPKTVLRKEIQIFKEIWWKTWNGNQDKSDHSKGFWPPEAAFSEAIIPVLVSEGYNWVIVANSHLARTCQNYMQVAQKGTSGWNIDPPNAADVLGPNVPSNQWWSGTLDGRGGAFPVPYAYQAHKAKYVDPNTGSETKITIVPMCDLLSYMNGFATMDYSIIPNKIAPWNDPNKPSIVLMAHDGDNAWGGGNSYYQESVPGFTHDAANKGYHPCTIEKFLAEWPVPDTDVVHVEDGSWFNAANDWGHPQFINWLYPPARSSTNLLYNATNPLTFYDLETPGWTEDWRNWAVLIAGANFCETAEQMTISNGGTVQAWKIQEPYQKNGTYNNPNEAERAWHFYLGGLDSGFMYYGLSLDDEVKQSLACNRAIQLAKIITDANPNLDQTPPTVFKPQRFPWNPGGMGWGQLTHYIPVGFENKPPWPSDFYIWTHVFDVSGVTNVTLYVRQDNDGVNPLNSNQNETYAGGSEVGSWVPIAMTKRTINPLTGQTGEVGEPNNAVNFFILPSYIADYYWAKVTGYRNKLLDYYIEAVDSKGNITKTDIQHVYVYDDGFGPPTAPPTPASVTATAMATNRIDVSWASSSGATGYIVKRAGSQIGTTSATSYSDIGLATSSNYCYMVVATNSVGSSAESSPPACAATFSPPPPNFSPPFVMDTSVDFTNYLQTAPGAPMALYAAVRGQMLYVATGSPGSNNNGPNDHFIIVANQLLSTTQPAFPDWAKAGANGVSTNMTFLGGESINTYVGWQKTAASNQCTKAGTTAGYMEGVINLVDAFGSMPSNIYVCAAKYATANGGALVAQGPAAVTANGNIESNEFLMLSIPALIDNNGDGVYDRLDPSKDFVIQSIQPAVAGGFTITWASVPGKTYEVMYCDSLGGGWQTLIQKTAQTGDITLSHTDNAASPQRFYKVKCVNP